MPKNNEPFESPGAEAGIAISLDGNPVVIPAQRQSLNSVRCFLETLALEKQRVLCSLHVDGHAVSLAQPLAQPVLFSRIDAESVALDESFILILQAAQQQVQRAQEGIENALTLVLINSRNVSREIWWNLAGQLKEPVLTLSLLPDHLCGPANVGASLKQLRKWQLQQIAAIIREVDETCATGNAIQLSDALEKRVLPWLRNLGELILLWQETVAAGMRLGINHAAK